MQSHGNRYMQPQHPAFYQPQIYHPVMYADNSDPMIPPQFVRVVAPGDYAGIMGQQPQQIWMNPGPPLPNPYNQVIVPQSSITSSVTKVDRGSDAIQLPKCMAKATQTSGEDLQAKEDVPMKNAAEADENWEVPDVKPGEKLHGWAETSSPEKKKSRSKEKNQSLKIETVLPENSSDGSKEKTVVKREKSRSPSKKGKSRSPAGEQQVPQEKIDRIRIRKDLHMDPGML